MKKKDISRLLQRYLTGHQEGKDAILMPMKSMNCWTVLKNLMIILTMMKSWL